MKHDYVLRPLMLVSALIFSAQALSQDEMTLSVISSDAERIDIISSQPYTDRSTFDCPEGDDALNSKHIDTLLSRRSEDVAWSHCRLRLRMVGDNVVLSTYAEGFSKPFEFETASFGETEVQFRRGHVSAVKNLVLRPYPDHAGGSIVDHALAPQGRCITATFSSTGVTHYRWCEDT